MAMRRTSDGFAIDIQRASWKSLQAGGTLQMPTSTMVPAGNLHIAMTRMADLAPLVGRPMAGSLDAALNATADKLHLTLRVDGAALAGTAAASRIALSADVDQPQSHPVLNARLDASGIQANGVTGSLRATANGPEDAVAVKLSASTPELSGSPGQLSAAATVDAVARTVSVASLQGEWHKEAIRLLAPVRVGFANGVAVDRLRIGLRQAVLDVSGRIGSTLDLTASFHGPADIARSDLAGLCPGRRADGGCPDHRFGVAPDWQRASGGQWLTRPKRSRARGAAGQHHRHRDTGWYECPDRRPYCRRSVASRPGG